MSNKKININFSELEAPLVLFIFLLAYTAFSGETSLIDLIKEYLQVKIDNLNCEW